MAKSIEPTQSQNIYAGRIAELKEWFGWEDSMIEFIRQGKGLKLVYRLMLAEKGD